MESECFRCIAPVYRVIREPRVEDASRLGVGAGRSGALPHKGENDIDGGSRNFYEFTQFLDGAKQDVDLHRPAALEVLEHRRSVGSDRSRSVEASFEPYPKSNAQFFSDTLRFGHHVPC